MGKLNCSKALPRITLVFILMLFMASCIVSAPNTFTKSEKITYVTKKELETAVIFRDTALSSAGDFYKRGLMSDSTKDKIIETGDLLYKAINESREVLKVYCLEQTVKSKLDLNKKTLLYREMYNRFSKLVYPYLLKRKDKEEMVNEW